MKPTVLLLAVLALVLMVVPVYSGDIIPISVVAFDGKVNIKDDDDKPVEPKKGANVPVGSTISTGVNSWIDLAQGGLSTIRVKSKTESFKVLKSSFDKDDNRTTSKFKLTSGSVYINTNKENLPKGSKYQIQMPEMITGIIGSQGECSTGPGGAMAHNFKGEWEGKLGPIGEGQSLVKPADGKMQIVPTPQVVIDALRATAASMARPTGAAVGGGCAGGTAAGVQPKGAAVNPSCSKPGDLLPDGKGGAGGTQSGNQARGNVGAEIAKEVAAQTAKDVAKDTAKDTAKNIAKDVGKPPSGGCSSGPCPPPPPPPPPPCR